MLWKYSPKHETDDNKHTIRWHSPETSPFSEQLFHFVHRRKRSHYWYWRNYIKSFAFYIVLFIVYSNFSKKIFFSSLYKWLQRTRIYSVLPEASVAKKYIVAKLMFTTNISIALSHPCPICSFSDWRLVCLCVSVCCLLLEQNTIDRVNGNKRSDWLTDLETGVWHPLWRGLSCSTITWQADG